MNRVTKTLGTAVGLLIGVYIGRPVGLALGRAVGSLVHGSSRDLVAIQEPSVSVTQSPQGCTDAEATTSKYTPARTIMESGSVSVESAPLDENILYPNDRTDSTEMLVVGAQQLTKPPAAWEAIRIGFFLIPKSGAAALDSVVPATLIWGGEQKDLLPANLAPKAKGTFPQIAWYPDRDGTSFLGKLPQGAAIRLNRKNGTTQIYALSHSLLCSLRRFALDVVEHC